MKTKFGFEISQGRQIDLDNLDTHFAVELSRMVGSWQSCINCGACAATCTAGSYSGLNLRKLHYSLWKSDPVELVSRIQNELSSCVLCGKCQLVCPRGISTRYIVINLMAKANDNVYSSSMV